MTRPDDERARRAEARRRRRDEQAAGTDSAPEQAGEANPTDDAGAPESDPASGDGASQARTVAKVAAAGAVVGAAVAAARAAGSRGSRSSDDVGQAPGDGAVAEVGDEAEAPRRDAEPGPADETGAGEPARDRSAEVPADREDASGEAEDRAEVEENESSLTAAGTVVKRAMRQLSDLAGHEAEGVLGIKKTDGGWLVEVELVELERIPPTTDVLGAYEVRTDEAGDIQQYRRVRRYVRSQADRGDES
jgi:hypothetical protein